MFDQQPTLELLFEQLGLESSSEAIDQFIESHQLTSDIPYIKPHSGARPSTISLSVTGKVMMNGPS